MLFEFVFLGTILLVLVTAAYLFCRNAEHDIPTEYFEDCSEYYLSTKLNGSAVVEKITTVRIGQRESITMFTHPLFEDSVHGYVMCCTDHGKTFLCHLSGSPGHLRIETKPLSHWDPGHYPVHDCKRALTFKNLMDFVADYDFGSYVLGTKDCRTFAKDVVKYLDQPET
jgi:hypothetical protein